MNRPSSYRENEFIRSGKNVDRNFGKKSEKSREKLDFCYKNVSRVMIALGENFC